MQEFSNLAAHDPEIQAALINIEAWGLSPRFTKTSLAIFAQNGLHLIDLHTKPQILFFAQEMGYIAKPDPSRPHPLEPASATIARLESELATERALRIKQSQACQALEKRRNATPPASNSRRPALCKT